MPRPTFRPAPGHVPVPAPPAEAHLAGARLRRGGAVPQEPQFRIPAYQRFARRRHTGKYRRQAIFPGRGSVAILSARTDVRGSGAGEPGRMDLRATVEATFAPARHPGLVGVELELIPVTDTPLPRPVAPALLAAGFDAGFVRAAAPSFEPGGQLELSPPPRPTVEDLATDVEILSRRATAIAAARGIRLEAVGLNPYHSCADVPLRLPTQRYLAMQRAFDEVGPDGRRMMRLTASLQIAVDLLPGRAGHEQWLVANLAGPPLAAAFANSAVTAGRPAGISGARTRIWQNADLRRTGYDGRHLDLTDPVGAYAAFAAAAPRLPIPDAEQPAYHLSTLFPPVRPRGGYLEVRYLDAQPLWRIPEAVGTVASLLYDDRARHDALDLLLPRAQDQHRAWAEAATGYSPEAGALLAIARAARPPAAAALGRGGVA
jgi:glutamate--cysteine ligase